MHPAPSVILFSTLSGLGFGLLVFLGFGLPAVTGWTAFGCFTLAYLLAVGGLIASTFHLGHPERALKAFSQWRTSWLSREAWMSVAALVVMALYGAGLVFWAHPLPLFGWIGGILSLGTVLCTAMIYTQMKTVPRWHTPLTPALFIALALAGGSLLAGYSMWSLALFLIAGALQIAFWRRGDRALVNSATTLKSATGLTGGSLRAFEPPHTGSNYLLREFVYVIGRKHARVLRIIAFPLGYVLPVLLLLTPLGLFATTLALLSHLSGILASRWLFFAEAEHVVGLYYGKR